MDIHPIKLEHRQGAPAPQQGFQEALLRIVAQTRRSWLGGEDSTAHGNAAPALLGKSIGGAPGRRAEREPGIGQQRLPGHHVRRSDQPRHG